jgi:hypothetical protein
MCEWQGMASEVEMYYLKKKIFLMMSEVVVTNNLKLFLKKQTLKYE